MTTLPAYEDALHTALSVVAPLGRQDNVDLPDAAGRVLCQSVVADRDLPPFNRAQMDGYALRANEVTPGRSFPVVGTIAAGMPADLAVPSGSCVAIATGAPLPDDVDTVIQHERSDRADPVTFTIDAIKPGHAVHPRGADAKAGDVLIAPPTVLAAHHLGIAASVGLSSLGVAARPRATVLSSGDEVMPMGAPVATHQIRNSNGIQIATLLRRTGAEPTAIEHAIDELGPSTDAVRRAIESSDLVVTIGGISAGERDHFPAAFEACGIQVALHRAKIQPGKPILVGRAPSGAIVVGLPGNPVSALACSCLFVWPIVRQMLGLPTDLPWRRVTLGETVKPNPRRRAFRPAILKEQAIVPKWAGSGDLAHTARTDGLLQLPEQDLEIPVGTSLKFLPWP